VTISICRDAALPELVQEAQRAYQRARRMVYDHLAPGEKPDPTRLREDQRRALAALEDAERALHEYRATVYV